LITINIGGGFECKGGKMGIKVSNVDKGVNTLDEGVKIKSMTSTTTN
jgi:hypothetical protein